MPKSKRLMYMYLSYNKIKILKFFFSFHLKKILEFFMRVFRAKNYLDMMSPSNAPAGLPSVDILLLLLLKLSDTLRVNVTW